MKILRVITSLNIGGAERSVATNVPYHIKNGYEMDVLVLNGNKTFFYENLIKNGVKVKSLGENKSVYNPLLILKLIKEIKNYDIVHVSLFPAFYWVAIAKMISFSKTKLIYTEHSTHNKRRDKFIFRLIDRIIYRQFKAIIAISPEANSNLSKHLNSKNKIITINNGVDISKLIEESKISLPKLVISNKKIITQIAGFRASKDQDTLIRAIKFLPEKVHIVFVGNGDRMEFCIQLAKQLNVYDRISFLGLQANVGAIIQQSDIIVMSSHWEGFGRAAIEGMALGKPVIATRVSGLEQVVENAGLLFEVGKEKKLAAQINKLIENTDLYNAIAQKCIERAKIYDSNSMISQYESVYTRVYNESNK